MGATCSPGPVEDDPRTRHLRPVASMNMLLSSSGDFEIDAEDDKISLKVGTGLSPLSYDVIGQLTGSNQNNEYFLKLMKKHTCALYFWCVVAFVCKGDGILGDKERRYIRETAQQVHGLTDKNLRKVVQVNKTYVKEYIASVGKVWSEFTPKMKKQEKDDKVHLAKEQVLFYTILAASQDGVAKKEFKHLNHLAQSLGLPQSEVMECAAIVQMEIDIATKLVKQFKPLTKK